MRVVSQIDGTSAALAVGDSLDMQPDKPCPVRCWLVAFVLAGALYCATVVPGVAFGDSGDAQLRVELGWWSDVKELSRSHPLYYFLAIGLKSLGIRAATAANYVSVVAGALTVANLAALLALMRLSRTAIVCAALVLGMSHAMWHISTLAEVMSLSTALLTFELICIHRWTATENPRWLVLAAMVNGLGLSTHNMAVLSWPAYVVTFWLVRKRHHMLNLRVFVACLFAGLLASSPLLVIFVESMQRGAGVFTVLHEMASGRYSTHVFQLFPGVTQTLRMGAYTAYSFPSPLILLVPSGLLVAHRLLKKPLFVFAVSALAIHFLFAIRYNVADQHVFLLHSYVLGMVFFAFGVDRWVHRDKKQRRVFVAVLLSCLAPVVFMVVPNTLRAYFPDVPVIPTRELKYREPYDSFLKPWRQGQDGADRFAREVLGAMPKDGILVLDTTVKPPILYIQQAEGIRRDVRIYNADPYQRFFEERVDLSKANIQRWISERRLCTVTNDLRYLSVRISGERFAYVPEGPVYFVVDAVRPGKSKNE